MGQIEDPKTRSYKLGGHRGKGGISSCYIAGDGRQPVTTRHNDFDQLAQEERWPWQTHIHKALARRFIGAPFLGARNPTV